MDWRWWSPVGTCTSFFGDADHTVENVVVTRANAEECDLMSMMI